MRLPFLTSELPGIGGAIKQRPEDFQVDEVPLYEASGKGDHVYFRVRKIGVSTQTAVERIARYMGRPARDFGVAGLKDARAVTTQYMSLEHADPDKLAAYKDPQVEVIWVGRHRNKLRTGHLAGNRFLIRIRSVLPDPSLVASARRILSVLERRGVPNFFGKQRFGARNDTALLGEKLFRGDGPGFVALFLGRPLPDDPPDCKAAREAFDAGDCESALAAWPRTYRNERACLKVWMRSRNPFQAIRIVDKRLRRFYVSAFQSLLFNEILSRRLDTLDRVFAGDLAMRTDSHGVFLVENETVEQPRAQAFKISPTAPLVGRRCRFAQGEPGRIEREVLASYGLSPDDFSHVHTVEIPGERRPLRFRISGWSVSDGVDQHGPYVEVSFSAPSGCYATIVLGEIMKAGA